MVVLWSFTVVQPPSLRNQKHCLEISRGRCPTTIWSSPLTTATACLSSGLWGCGKRDSLSDSDGDLQVESLYWWNPLLPTMQLNDVDIVSVWSLLSILTGITLSATYKHDRIKLVIRRKRIAYMRGKKSGQTTVNIILSILTEQFHCTRW